MPPRLNLLSANKAVSALRQPTIPCVASRSIALPLRFRAEQLTPAQKRWNSSKKEPNPDEQVFPTQDQLPHVSEEAAEIDRIMNKEKSCDGQPSSPELEQGTPVEEVSSAVELLAVTSWIVTNELSFTSRFSSATRRQ
jgi:hypothetical protein